MMKKLLSRLKFPKTIKLAAIIFITVSLLALAAWQKTKAQKNKLIDYVPPLTAAFIQIKEPSILSGGPSLSDSRLEPFYEIIDKLMDWPLSFNSNVLPLINREFIVMIKQDALVGSNGLFKAVAEPLPASDFSKESFSGALIFETKYIAEADWIFKDYSHFWIGNSIMAVCANSCDEYQFKPAGGGSLFKDKFSGYNFLSLYLDTERFYDINKFLNQRGILLTDQIFGGSNRNLFGARENTKIEHRLLKSSNIGGVYATASPKIGWWRYSLRVDSDRLSYSQPLEPDGEETGDGGQALPPNYIFYGENTDAKEFFAGYFLDLLGAGFDVGRNKNVGRDRVDFLPLIDQKLDWLVLDIKDSGLPKYVLILKLKQSQYQDFFQVYFKRYLARIMPQEREMQLPDRSQSVEFVINPEIIQIQRDESDEELYFFRNDRMEIAWQMDNGTIFLADSAATIKDYQKYTADSARASESYNQKCWFGQPASHLSINMDFLNQYLNQDLNLPLMFLSASRQGADEITGCLTPGQQ